MINLTQKKPKSHNTPNARRENEAITRLTNLKIMLYNKSTKHNRMIMDAAQTGGIQALDNVNANVVKKQQARVN